MNFRRKFRHRRSIRRPRFPVTVQNFGDLATFSVDFCILYSECPPYFYFRFVWPTHLESIPAVCWYDGHVTLTFDRLTLNSYHTWRVRWPTLPPSMKTLRLSVLELRVITFPISCHWKCIRCQASCISRDESRDPWVGSEERLHFWNPRPRFAYSVYNFGGSTMNIIKVICEIMHALC